MLKTAIDSLPGTSALTIRKLKSLEIKTYWDLINYFPFRYENYSLISSINKLQPGETTTIKGKTIEAKNTYTRNRITIQKIKLNDGSGEIHLTWFNQPYLINLFRSSPYVSISGAVKISKGKLTVEPKEFETLSSLSGKTIHTGRIVPIYPAKHGLSSRTLREKIYVVLNKPLTGPVTEFLPVKIINQFNLLGESSAYQNIHFPQSMELADKARVRLSFDELFILSLSTYLTRQQWEKERIGNPFKIKENLVKLKTFVQNLPFKLTSDQQKSVKVILKDLSSSRPMNRFLHGDVGSGKTVVAAIAAYASYLSGLKTLFMAPTEILISQHYQTLQNLFKESSLKIGIQTGAKKNKSIDEFDLILGTHALLSQKLSIAKIGLVIIDEQHRFGVQQRSILKAKGINPHLLTMTATPIPRTVALTLYRELDISTIEEMPINRIPIKTFLVPKDKRNNGYAWIRKKIKEGDQAFIICPLIEESEAETMQSVKAVTKEYEYLTEKVFADLKLGLLHGRMKSQEKDQIMKGFEDRKYDILVSTPVVEVGIDIPNATIMVIEAAERYGLAQIHQLRGRVGRGKKQSFCLLYTEKEDKNILNRLKFMAGNSSGMKIAEYDFKRRGPGEIYGTQQHGYLDLNIASLADFPLIEKTKQAVDEFVADYNIDDFPEIKRRIEKYKLDQISQD